MEKIYRLVSTSRKRVLESPFCLCGERIAAFYLEEASLRMARMLRESAWCRTVYGCYDQPGGTFLIGPASARAGGRFRQKISLRRVTGKLAPSVPVWKNVRVRRVIGELADFVQTCLTRV